ncbi:hypothetical protein D3C74_397060 [compost metagenome]
MTSSEDVGMSSSVSWEATDCGSREALFVTKTRRMPAARAPPRPVAAFGMGSWPR